MDAFNIGCIIMASGLSRRYGRNKLLEKLSGREVILHTADHLMRAGLTPLAVTRSDEVKALLDDAGIACISHDGALKSDTMHVGILGLKPGTDGYLFMPGDQPLVLPDSIRRLTAAFSEQPCCAVRLGYENISGSPVIFPASLRDALLSYTGDRGGMEVLKKQHESCRIIDASFVWELWDVDTPEKMQQAQTVYTEYYGRFDKNRSQ